MFGTRAGCGAGVAIPWKSCCRSGRGRRLGRSGPQDHGPLREDGRAGRVYLPDDVLRDAGIDPADAAVRLAGFRSLPEATRRSIVAPQAALAEAAYAAGLASIHRLANGRRAIAAAALLYREILRTIVREDHGGHRDRVVVSRGRKLALLVRALGRGPT